MTTHAAGAAPIDGPGRDGEAFRHWLRNAARCGLFSGLIGLSLSLIEPTLYGLVENLVYSECIGLSIYAGITLLGRLFPSEVGGRAFMHYLLRGLIAVPLGLFVGLNLAAALRGNPIGFAVLNRAAIFALPITIVASVATMYFLWSRKRIADASAANELAQRHIAEARLKLLQAQIEPHMLFNTLANLRTLVEVDPPRAQTMLDQLIVYLRGTLAASRAATTTLEQEFAHLAAYLELMRVRMASRLQVAIDLPEPLRACAIPPMLLQPLVENAIKHGLEPKIEGGTVRIAASIVDGRLRIEVIDDGIGFAGTEVDVADPGDAGGYGLAHVRERLQTLYGDTARLVIGPRPGGGVCARVDLPR